MRACFNFCSLIVLLAAVTRTQAVDRLVNYQNDPDLALAMQHDYELNGGDRLVGNQKTAEKHYLAFLAKAEDSAQRTRVYVQLGVLFSTSYDRRKGEKPDWVKARRYFRSALKEEPERYSRAMIRARLGQCTPDVPAEGRLRTRIETYKWLQKVASGDLEKVLIPATPAAQPVRPGELRGMQSLLRNVMLAEDTNIIAEAAHTKNPWHGLKQVVDLLPGTPAAERAQHLLKQPQMELFEERISTIDETLPSIDVECDERAVGSSEQTAGRNPAPGAVAEHATGGRFNGQTIAWIVVSACVLIVLTTWLIRRKRCSCRTDGPTPGLP